MTQLLIQGEVILAQGPFTETDTTIVVHKEVPREWRDAAGNLVATITVDDLIIQKHVVEGWQIVEHDLPADFTCAGYLRQGGELVKKPESVDKDAHNAALDTQIQTLEAKCIRPMRDVLAANLSGAEPDADDVAKLTELKSEIDQLRAQRLP